MTVIAGNTLDSSSSDSIEDVAKNRTQAPMEIVECAGEDKCKLSSTVRIRMPGELKMLTPLEKFQKNVGLVIMIGKLFGWKNYDELAEGERKADEASYLRNSTSRNLEEALQAEMEGPRRVRFAAEFPVYEIEDLTKRTCSWGDIWSDLYYEQDELAEMKYQAFLEESGLENWEREAPSKCEELESSIVCEEKKVQDEEPTEVQSTSAAEDEECAGECEAPPYIRTCMFGPKSPSPFGYSKWRKLLRINDHYYQSKQQHFLTPQEQERTVLTDIVFKI
jgi:hypothetical protein